MRNGFCLHVSRMLLVVVLLSTGLAGAAQSNPFAGLPLMGDAPSQGDQKFSFAILGDKTSGGEGKWPIFDRAVDAINLLEPDFVITVGDQIPGHMQDRAQWDLEWAEYLEHARRLDKPLLLIPGNHDIANIECYRFWKEDFGPTYYAFDYRDCHFLVLNTEEERFDGRGPVWEAMMRFAEDDLAQHTASRHTFLFFHKPMWDDPRYDADWKRVETALGARKYTVVAGHEHYLMTERRNGNLYVIQSATGGGIALSSVREYGAFHSVGFVTVDGDAVTYAVAEPSGGIWPVEVAPAAFRKAIAYELVRLDAERPEDLDAATVTLRATLRFHNVLDAPVTVEATVGKLATCGWEPVLNGDTSRTKRKGDTLVIEVALDPGERVERPLTFRVPQARLAYPPRVSWRVRYEGEWIDNESFPMVQESVIPIAPAACLRAVPEWQLVGPFPLGDIDTTPLPADPAAANANFFHRFGPEEGYDAERIYDGGLKWFPVRSQGRGLLNFNALMGTLDHALGYALCGVYSPHAQRTHAVVYSDNFSQGVLNGGLLEDGQDFGAPGGFTHIPLRLEGGWNTLILKLINNRGDWFLRVLVADPEGNLEFAPHPPAAG